MNAMKKNIKNIVAIAAIALMSSCSDHFLNVDAPSISEESFFSNERQADLALTGAYDVLGWDDTSYFPFWLGDILGHDAYKGGEGPGDQPWIEPFLNFQYNGANPGLLVPFQQYYIGINRCNRVIDKTADMTADMISDD